MDQDGGAWTQYFTSHRHYEREVLGKKKGRGGKKNKDKQRLVLFCQQYLFFCFPHVIQSSNDMSISLTVFDKSLLKSDMLQGIN